MEAAISAELMGNHVERLYDVGVAGIHRLLERRERLWKAAVLIVVYLLNQLTRLTPDAKS